MVINGRQGLTRGNGNGRTARSGPGMAKYSGHTHGNVAPYYPGGWGQSSIQHAHTTLVESPPHSGASGHIHSSSVGFGEWGDSQYPTHTHASQTYGHSGSMGTHQGGWPSGPSTGSYHNHNMATGSGTHLHPPGRLPASTQRSGRGGRRQPPIRRTMGNRRGGRGGY